jgi:hypothetical protein
LTLGVNVPAEVLGTNTGAARLTDLEVVVDVFVRVEAIGGGILFVSLNPSLQAYESEEGSSPGISSSGWIVSFNLEAEQGWADIRQDDNRHTTCQLNLI